MHRDIHDSSLTFVDGTPDYMHIPSAACRIRSTFPDAKLIVLLRDPVARALSQWNMVKALKFKPPAKGFDIEVNQSLFHLHHLSTHRPLPSQVNSELAGLRAKHCSFEPQVGGAVGAPLFRTPVPDFAATHLETTGKFAQLYVRENLEVDQFLASPSSGSTENCVDTLVRAVLLAAAEGHQGLERLLQLRVWMWNLQTTVTKGIGGSSSPPR